MYFKASFGYVTIDILFVFVAKNNIISFRYFTELSEMVNDFIFIVVGILSFGCIEGEKSDVVAVEDFCNFKSVLEFIKMLTEVIGYVDFTYR